MGNKKMVKRGRNWIFVIGMLVIALAIAGVVVGESLSLEIGEGSREISTQMNTDEHRFDNESVGVESESESESEGEGLTTDHTDSHGLGEERVDGWGVMVDGEEGVGNGDKFKEVENE